MTIKSARVNKILNSVGTWTIEATLSSNSHTAVASVPKGKSAGEYEAKDLPTEKAIEKFEEIKSKVIGQNFDSSKQFDEMLLELDGTAHKSNLGANLILGLSIAFLKLISKEIGLEPYEYISKFYEFDTKIPSYSLLIFEGGKHGSHLITAQEYMLILEDIKEAQDIIHTFNRYLVENGLFVGYGLEGAFTSAKLTDLDVLNLIRTVTPHKKIAIDVAESSRQGDSLDYENIIRNYNIYSIEDPKQEKDYKGWSKFFNNYGHKIVVVGDDLTTTNTVLIKNAHDEKMINAVIIKPNQIGSILETIQAVKLAKEYGWKIIVSHRGTDTPDDFISDLSVGIGADHVKFGGLQRGERIAKYNRMLKIQEVINIPREKVTSIS